MTLSWWLIVPTCVALGAMSIMMLFDISWLTFESVNSYGTTNDKRPVVLIVGGTGQQGGAAIEYFFQQKLHHEWIIRTITRDLQNEAVEKLHSKGVQVFYGDLKEPESIKKAMKGVKAVFGITFSDFIEGKELSHGKTLGDIAKTEGVDIFVYSGGQHTGVDFLDVKYNIQQYIESLDIPITLFLHTSFFIENLVTKRGTRRIHVDQNEKYYFETPLPKNLKLPMISAGDIGRIAAYAITHPDFLKAMNGQSIPLAGDVISCAEYVDIFKHISGYDVNYSTIPLHSFETQPYSWAKKVADMYRWYINKGHYIDPAITKDIFPQVLSVEEWMKRYGVELIKDLAIKK